MTLRDEPKLSRTEPELRLSGLAAELVEERRKVAELRREVAELKSRLQSLQPTQDGDTVAPVHNLGRRGSANAGLRYAVTPITRPPGSRGPDRP